MNFCGNCEQSFVTFEDLQDHVCKEIEMTDTSTEQVGGVMELEAIDLVKIIYILGKNQVFEVRRKALCNMTNETVEYEGLLLGGKLKITLEFDERGKA